MQKKQLQFIIKYFELNLQENNRIIICKYEDLVKSPSSQMKSIYSFAGFEFPGEKIVANVHSNSVNKGHEVNLSPKIEILCETMLNKLNSAYTNQKTKIN